MNTISLALIVVAILAVVGLLVLLGALRMPAEYRENQKKRNAIRKKLIQREHGNSS